MTAEGYIYITDPDNNIETILKNIHHREKFTVPNDWKYKQARDLFKNPEVHDPDQVEVSSQSIRLKLNIAKTYA